MESNLGNSRKVPDPSGLSLPASQNVPAGKRIEDEVPPQRLEGRYLDGSEIHALLHSGYDMTRVFTNDERGLRHLAAWNKYQAEQSWLPSIASIATGAWQLGKEVVKNVVTESAEFTGLSKFDVIADNLPDDSTSEPPPRRAWMTDEDYAKSVETWKETRKGTGSDKFAKSKLYQAEEAFAQNVRGFWMMANANMGANSASPMARMQRVIRGSLESIASPDTKFGDKLLVGAELGLRTTDVVNPIKFGSAIPYSDAWDSPEKRIADINAMMKDYQRGLRFESGESGILFEHDVTENKQRIRVAEILKQDLGNINRLSQSERTILVKGLTNATRFGFSSRFDTYQPPAIYSAPSLAARIQGSSAGTWSPQGDALSDANEFFNLPDAEKTVVLDEVIRQSNQNIERAHDDLSYLDPRKMPVYKIYFDPNNALPYGAGRSAVSAVVGAERAAKWGNSILDWQANWQKFIGSKAGEGLNLGSEFIRKEITERLTGWVDDGIEYAGKHVSVATNITADQFSKAAKTIGYVAGAAGFAGIGVPYASAAAMTYGGLKLISGVAESTAKVGTTIARQSGERGLLNFARETLLLEEQIAAKAGTTVPLQNKLALTAMSLSEPFLSTAWQGTKAATAGAAVGATMTAFGAPNPDQFWQSVGTAGAMGLTGGLVGGMLSEIQARKALNLENQAAVILNVKKPFDATLARQLEILRTMTSTDVFGSTNLHRQAVNEFIIALSNKREGMVPELYLHFGQESVNAQVKAWIEKGYKQVDGYSTKLGAVEHAAGYVFKSPSGRDVIGINMNDFFARTEGLYGRHTLLHELTHTFNNDATLGPMIKHRIMNTIVGHFIGVRSENGERTYALQSRSNTQSWASVTAFMDSALASLRQDAAEASSAGPDLARERSGAFAGDVQATEAVFASIKDKLAPEKFGDKAVPLTQHEFDTLASLAEEYYTTYTEGRGFDPKRVYLGGRTEGLGAALSMLADSIVKTVPKALRRNVDHAQGIGLFGKDYDLSRGFLEKNGKWRVMRDLDDIYYDTLKMESALRDTGKINLNELSPAGREVAMYNLGMDQMLFRDSTGRVVRGRRGAVARPNETILMGTEAIKVIRALKPELRASRETADGGIAGPFSDAEFDALVQGGFMSPQYADNCRLMQSIANDRGQGKIINFIYNGESRQVHTDADNVRLFGDSVPVTHRTAYVIDHTIEFNAKGEFTSRIRSLDLMANIQRLQNLWRDAEVRKLWNDRYDDFERDYFETYLGNASLPEGHPEKVDSATALGKNGEAKRQIMHQAAGFTKADDLSWINLPIAQIPRGTLSTITDFSVGRMAVITQESHGRSFHYEHKNAFYPISRNFRPSTLRTEVLPDGKMHSNDLGYKVLERQNKFTLLSPDGTRVGEHSSVSDAMEAAEDHFDKNVTKPVFARNAAIIREQATFRGKGLRKKMLSENKDVVRDPLLGENLYAFFASMLTKHDMKVPEILEALQRKGYPFEYKYTASGNKKKIVFAADGINTREYSVQWNPNTAFAGAKNDILLESPPVMGRNGPLDRHTMTIGEFTSRVSILRAIQKTNGGKIPLVMRLRHGTPNAALLTDPNVHPSVSKAGTGYGKFLEGNLTRYYDLLTNREMYVELTESQIRAGRSVAPLMDESTDWSSYHDFDNPGLVSLVQPDLGVFVNPLKRTPQVVVDLASARQHYELSGDHAGLARIAAGLADRYDSHGDIVDAYRQVLRDYPNVFEERETRVGNTTQRYYTVKRSFAARPAIRDAVQSMVDSLGKQAIARVAKENGALAAYISRVPDSGLSNKSGLNDAVDVLALDDGAIEKVGSNTVLETDSGPLVIDSTLRAIDDPSANRRNVRIWNKSEKRLVTPLTMEEFRTGAGLVGDAGTSKQVSLFDSRSPLSPESQLRYAAYRPKSKSGYRADSLLNTTVNYGNSRVSKLEKIVQELISGVTTRVASDRVYRNSGIVDVADVKEVHKRWSEMAAVMKAEYDSGILSKEAYEANMDSIRLQVATEVGIVAQKAEIEADLHVAIQGLSQDISNLGGHVGSFISGSYWGDSTYGQTAKEVAEIGPICGNMRLDEALRLGRYADAPNAIEQITQAVLDGRHTDSNVWTLGGRAELDAAIGRLSVDVQRATDGLVDVVFINRRDCRLSTVEDQPVMRPTFVWTQKAIEIRNKYRQIIPEHVWKQQNMTWDSVRAESTMGDRLRQLDWYAGFERDVSNAITSADRLTKGLLNTHDTRRQLALDLYTKKQTESAADYDSYLKKMQEGRALVEQKALDEAIKAIEVERGMPLPRVVPEVDVEGLTSHHEAITKAERLGEIYEQAKAAKDSGDANALRAFAAGFIDSVAQKALVDFGKEPEITGTYYTDVFGVMGDASRDVLAYNLKKMLDDSDFFKQVHDEYMQANYGKTFVSPLRRIVDIITAKNPNGITASNFEVEMKKLMSQGIPAAEEARVTGFADWLAEKKAAPNMPNGKKPKLDFSELETFLSSKGLDVEVDLTGPLDMSGNASQYRLSPDVYSTDYGVLIARTNRPEYWPNKRRVEGGGSLHPREKGSKPGTGRPAKDSIAHLRYTIRDFPDLTGRPVKTLLIEEAQMGNDKKYLDAALASDAYWKSLSKAIDETVQIVGQKAAKPAPVDAPKDIKVMPDYSHDPSNLDSVAEYVLKLHNGFVTDSMTLTNALFYPHKYAGYRYANHHDASSAYAGRAKNDLQIAQDTSGRLDPEQRRVFNASMAYADVVYSKAFNAARKHAANIVREFPSIISDYVKLVREKGAPTDSQLTSGDGAEEFHSAFLRAYKKKLSGEIPYMNPGSEAFGMLSGTPNSWNGSRSFAAGAASAFAGLISESTHAKIVELMNRYMQASDINDRVQPHRGWSADSHHESLLSAVIDGVSYKDALSELVKSEIGALPVVERRDRDGFVTKVHELRFKAGVDSDSFDLDSGLPEHVVYIPILDKASLARLAIEATESLTRFGTSGSFGRTELRGTMVGPMLPILQSTYAMKSTALHSGLTRLWADMRRSGYGDWAAMASINDVIAFAQANGIKVSPSFVNLISSYKAANSNRSLGEKPLVYVLNSARRDVSGSACGIGTGSGFGGIVDLLETVMRDDPSFVQSAGTQISGQSGDGSPLRRVNFYSTHYPNGDYDALITDAFAKAAYPTLRKYHGIPDEFAKRLGGAYGAVNFPVLARTLADARAMARVTSDPSVFLAQRVVNQKEIFSIMQQTGFAKLLASTTHSLVQNYRNSAGAATETLHSVMSALGLEGTPFYKFAYPERAPAGTNLKDIQSFREAYSSNSRMVPSFPISPEHSKPSEVVTAFQQAMNGRITPDELRKVLMDSYIKKYEVSNAWEHDRALMRTPFLESEDYFGVTFKMALKHAVELGCERIQIIPGLDAGSRSGLGPDKAQHIYDSQYSSIAAKYMKKIGIAAETSGRAFVPIDAPAVQIDAMRAKMEASTNAKNTALKKIYRKATIGDTPYVAKTEHALAASLIRAMFPFDKTSGTFPDNFVPAMASMPTGSEGYSSRSSSFSNLGMPVSKESAEINNYVALVSGEQRQGGWLSYKHPRFVAEIYAAHMYKAAKDSGSIKMTVPEASNHAKAQAMGALSWFHESLSSRSNVFSKPYDRNVGLVPSDASRLWSVFADKVKKNFEPSAVSALEASVKEYLDSNPSWLSGITKDSPWYQDIGDNAEFAKKVTQAMRDLIDLGDLLHAEVEAHHEYYSSAKRTPDGRGDYHLSAMMTRNVSGDLVGMPESAKKVIDEGQFFFRPKTVKGELSKDSTQWKSGFMGTLASELPKLASQCRLSVQQGNRDANGTIPLTVTLYPRVSENLSPTHKDVSVMALFDPQSLVANVRILNAGRDSRHTLMALDEVERRLSTMGAVKYVGDILMPGVFGRIDTDAIQPVRPLSRHDMYSDFTRSQHGQDVLNVLEEAGYEMRFGALDSVDRTPELGATEAEYLLNQKPRVVRMSIEKNGSVAAYIDVSLRPDSTASVIDYDLKRPVSGLNAGQLGPRVEQNAKQMMVHELLQRLQTFYDLRSFDGINQIDLPGIDTMRNDFSGAIPEDEPILKSPKRGVTPGYENLEYGYGRFARAEPERETAPKQQPQIPPRQQVWEMSKTGNYTTLTSEDQYFILLSSKGFRVYSPNKHLLGVFETEEEAKRKAYKDSMRRKP